MNIAIEDLRKIQGIGDKTIDRIYASLKEEEPQKEVVDLGLLPTYEKDGIKLINGETLAVMDALIEAGVKVDAIITDPPFATTQCSWDSLIPFDEMWERLNKMVKSNGAIVLFGTEPFSSNLRVSNIRNYKYDWVWEKTSATGHLNAKKMPMKAHELVSVFYKKPPTYNPQKTTGHERKVSSAHHKRNSLRTEIYNEHDLTSYDSTERYPRSVLLFKTDKQKSALHPTQKPVLLMEYLIKTYTKEGETILDFTFGSGTTLVAAKNTNRQGIGIELEKKYFDIAVNRLDGL